MVLSPHGGCSSCRQVQSQFRPRHRQMLVLVSEIRADFVLGVSELRHGRRASAARSSVPQPRPPFPSVLVLPALPGKASYCGG